MKSIVEMTRPGKKVYFVKYQKNELWYRTDDGFTFPVPIEDTGEGAFLAEDNASMFRRYITKQLKAIETAFK